MPEDVKTLLGGLSPAAFLRLHWQKEARLCRQAIAGFSGVLDRAAMQKLAARDDVESRLVIASTDAGRWPMARCGRRTSGASRARVDSAGFRSQPAFGRSRRAAATALRSCPMHASTT